MHAVAIDKTVLQATSFCYQGACFISTAVATVTKAKVMVGFFTAIFTAKLFIFHSYQTCYFYFFSILW